MNTWTDVHINIDTIGDQMSYTVSGAREEVGAILALIVSLGPKDVARMLRREEFEDGIDELCDWDVDL